MPDDQRVVATLASMPEYAQHFRQAFPGEKKPVSAGQRGARHRRLRAPAHHALALRPVPRRASTARSPSRSAGAWSSSSPPAAPRATTAQRWAAPRSRSWASSTTGPHVEDPGRFEVTRNEEDRTKFRVPTLRNVEKTGPYLHDGSIQALPEMVRLMAKHQLGKDAGRARGRGRGGLPAQPHRRAAPALHPAARAAQEHEEDAQTGPDVVRGGAMNIPLPCPLRAALPGAARGASWPWRTSSPGWWPSAPSDKGVRVMGATFNGLLDLQVLLGHHHGRHGPLLPAAHWPHRDACCWPPEWPTGC